MFSMNRRTSTMLIVAILALQLVLISDHLKPVSASKKLKKLKKIAALLMLLKSKSEITFFTLSPWFQNPKILLIPSKPKIYLVNLKSLISLFRDNKSQPDINPTNSKLRFSLSPKKSFQNHPPTCFNPIFSQNIPTIFTTHQTHFQLPSIIFQSQKSVYFQFLYLCHSHWRLKNPKHLFIFTRKPIQCL